MSMPALALCAFLLAEVPPRTYGQLDVRVEVAEHERPPLGAPGSCPEDCRGRGVCMQWGGCDCFRGYAGPACEAAPPVYCFNACSGAGICDRGPPAARARAALCPARPQGLDPPPPPWRRILPLRARAVGSRLLAPLERGARARREAAPRLARRIR